MRFSPLAAWLFATPWLVATGCIDTQLQAAATEAAVNPDLVDFGTVAVGTTATGTIQVDSVGYGELTVVSVTIQGVGGTSAFTLDGDFGGTKIPKGDSLALPVLYTPSVVGADEADVTVQTDANMGENAFTVAVRGRGALPGLAISPSSIDFGYVEPGSDPSIAVLVQSTSTVTSQIASASIDGDDSFYLDGLTTPLDVVAGGSQSFSVVFGAPDTVARTATLTLVTDDPELGTLSIPIFGNSCEGAAAEDADGDGVAVCAGDCDDADATVALGVPEALDGLDNDCDGTTDEGTSAYDDDGDGWSEEDGDCADADDDLSPDAVEVADGVDQDCDGLVDEETDAYDDDGDGFTEDGGDCDDGDGNVSPGASEQANGDDDDCDGEIDEGTSAGDDDGDGFDEGGGDCDDTDATIYPRASEVADGADQDCDGTVDEGTDAYDDDGDGYTEDGGDCDDTDASVGPNVLESMGDGIDNDCDGVRQ